MAYPSRSTKESDEHSHTLFLLLMVVLLFSNGFESDVEMYANDKQYKNSIEMQSNEPMKDRSVSITSALSPSSSSPSVQSPSASPNFLTNLNEKLRKIQNNYIDIACRYLRDEFGLSVGRQMFQNLLPLLMGE